MFEANGRWTGAGACITTHNEATTIGGLVRALVGMGLSVFVVDDRSTDATAYYARCGGATVAQQTGPRGLGPGLMQAWQMALDAGCERVVQLDAGGSHSPQDAVRLLAALDRCQADMVVGSRFMRGGRYVGRPWRAALSRLAAAACNFAQAGSGWSDWTSGLRAFRAEALRKLLGRVYQARMHAAQIEVLAWAGALGMTIIEKPITYMAGRSAFNWRVAEEAVGVWLEVLHHVPPVERV